MDKKEKERIILQMVYNLEHFEEVIENESPDFKIKHPATSYYFGVEVTEFYFTESDARLKNISKYWSELLDGEGYRHKDDREILRVDEIKIINPDDEVVGTPEAIIRKLPSLDEYLDLIIDRIVEKNKKVNQEEYLEDVNHVNLIILDRENRVSTESEEFAIELLSQPKLQRCLQESDFREIFLVTELKNKGRFFIPLKHMLFLTGYYLFLNFKEKYSGKYDLADPETTLITFGVLMAETNHKVYVKNDAAKGTMIFLEKFGVAHFDNGYKIKDFKDESLPKGLQSISKIDVDISKSLINEFVQYFNEHFIKFKIANRVITDHTFR